MAEARITVNIEIAGLGSGIQCKDTFTDSTTPEVAIHIDQQEQETADTAEALNGGAVDTVKGVWIRAIENDIAIDTSYSVTFSTELVVAEGTTAYFVPSGTVYIKNNTAAEQCKFEFTVWGTQD
jgi:hypothetical protein